MTEKMAHLRKTKLMNNVLKQRQHDVYDQNFNSSGVEGIVHFTNRDRRLQSIGAQTLQ